jgi:phospholipase/carboxylesterase
MNRLASLLGVDVSETSAARDQADAAFCSSKRRGIDHSSFAPLHYEKNYAYPLFIWLHGADDNEMQLRKVMPHVSLRNYVAMAPRGTRSAASDYASEISNLAADAIAADHLDSQYSDLDPFDSDCPASAGQAAAFCWHQAARDIEQAEESVRECIEIARSRFHVAPHRVFLAGYDCGGTMALRLAFRHPQWFAGVASFNGPFPFGHCPLLQVNAAREVPVLIAHGRESELYDEQRVCDDLRLLHAAGVSTTLRQYPGGDELTTQMLCDLDHWMMELITGRPATVEPTWEGKPGWDHRN